MIKRKKFFVFSTWLLIITLFSGMVFSVAGETNDSDLNTADINTSSGFSWNVDNKTTPSSVAYYNGLTETFEEGIFGDETKGASLKLSYGSDQSPMMNISNPISNIPGSSVVSYSFDVGINSFSANRDPQISTPYYFQLKVNNGFIKNYAMGLSIDHTGKIILFGVDTGKTISSGSWHTFRLLLASFADNSAINVSLYMDGKLICNAVFDIPSAAIGGSYTIDFARFCNNSTASILYVDNIHFESKAATFIQAIEPDLESLIDSSRYEIVLGSRPDLKARSFQNGTKNAIVLEKDGSQLDEETLLKDCCVYTEYEPGYRISWSISTASSRIIKFDSEEKMSASYFYNIADMQAAFSSNTQIVDSKSGSVMSAKWDLSDSSVNDKRMAYLKQKNIEINWTRYDYIKLRLYSTNNNNAKVLFRGMANENAGGQVAGTATFYVDWKDSWKTITLPIKDFATETAAGMTQVNGISMVILTGHAGDSLYLDEIWLESENDPQSDTSLTSDLFCVENESIHGYRGLTVAQLLESAIIPEHASLACFSADSSPIVDTSSFAQAGMYLRVTSSSGQRCAAYTLDIPWYKAGFISCAINGSTANGKFTTGTLQVSLPVTQYTNADFMPILVAAQYQNGALLSITTTKAPVKKQQPTTLSLTKEITQTENTTIKLMAFEAFETIAPLTASVKLEPYSKDEINFELRYPGYTTKAVTFSYDDGLAQDERLAKLFRNAGLKATFNVVGQYFTKGDGTYAARYTGHEIANHTYDHPYMYLTQSTQINGVTVQPLTLEQCQASIAKGNTWIEDTFGSYSNGYGFVWPYRAPIERSDYNELLEYLKSTGAKYIRPTTTTGTFELPTDWYDWSPTCHHDDANQYLDAFFSAPTGGELKLFSIWGHAHELDETYHPNETGKLRWDTMEVFLNQFKGRTDIWSATNMEIHDYIEATRKLELDYVNNSVTNPSSIAVYAQVNGHNIYIPANQTVALIQDYENAIACWGDSLTYGETTDYAYDASVAYPAVLENLTGIKTYNLGVGGETSTTIAARQGAYNIRITEDFTIPRSGAVSIKFAAYEGDTYAGVVTPRDVGYGMWNPCFINGVEGTLSVSVNTNVWPRILNSATFTRKTDGNEVAVKAGDLLIPAAQNVKADINVFFTGTNHGWTAENLNSGEDPQKLAELVGKQIAHAGSGKYIVLGLTSGDASTWTEENAALQEAFGANYLDLKGYLASSQALADAGLTATDTDMADLANGHIPNSLLSSDRVHFNKQGYALIAKKVQEKLIELGYIAE